MSQQQKHARLRYRLLLWSLIPPLVLLCLWQALRYRDPLFFFQRLGLLLPKPPPQSLWVHCASVGEIHAAIPLLNGLREAQPKANLLVSTTTPTGGRILRNKLRAQVQACYLPIDWPSAMRRFITGLKPRCAIIVETEIWPNLYHVLAQQDVPLVLVNGRLSPRTLNAPAWILSLYRQSLGLVTCLLARSQLDLERFLTLGAPAARSETVGNIKFSAPPVDPATVHDICPRPYVLAASTHADEERRITKAWLDAAADPYPILVIAPRHPKRRTAILNDLAALNVPVAVRSRGEAIVSDTRIYLADTLGEMPSLIHGATFVIMGGSFIKRGGHNILEPAAQGKAVITGPWMDSFIDETQLLKQAGGLIQCQEAELTENIRRLLTQPTLAADMGKRARALIQSQQQVLPRYLARLTPYL